MGQCQWARPFQLRLVLNWQPCLGGYRLCSLTGSEQAGLEQAKVRPLSHPAHEQPPRDSKLLGARHSPVLPCLVHSLGLISPCSGRLTPGRSNPPPPACLQPQEAIAPQSAWHSPSHGGPRPGRPLLLPLVPDTSPGSLSWPSPQLLLITNHVYLARSRHLTLL